MDISITWPKKRPLESYLAELIKAEAQGLVINYRVPSLPKVKQGDRCYVVYDGFIRGYNEIIEALHREDGEVARVAEDAFAGFWPAGFYVVRDPVWHHLEKPIECKGFRGYCYANFARQIATPNLT